MRQLPDEEKEGLKEYLLGESGNICPLCELGFNIAHDLLVADHIIPVHENGETNRDNLQLTHSWCNSVKQNYSDEDVKPFIKFAMRYNQSEIGYNYREALENIDLFENIVPSQSGIVVEEGAVNFQFADNTETRTNIYVDSVGEREFNFCFVEVPILAIFNDDECQPRAIKSPHIRKIYFDLLDNPLNEPPCCRIQNDGDGLFKILMFDGQHKTISSILRGKEKIVIKLYLDMTREEATRLINTIQNKIVKLKASSFEAMGKLAQEFQSDYYEYAQNAGDEASEAGFIASIEVARRTRAKDALWSANVSELRELQTNVMNWIRLNGRAPPNEENYPSFMTETMFKNKIAFHLLEKKPLTQSGELGTQQRIRERNNATRLINYWIDAVATTNGAQDTYTPSDKIRIERMMKQTAQVSIMKLIKSIFARLTNQELDVALLISTPDEQTWNEIQAAIERVVSHPVWSTHQDVSEPALRLNQLLQGGYALTDILIELHCGINYALVGELPDNVMQIQE